MRERRFLVPELQSEPEPEIRGPEAHHLLHVLRLKAGDEVVLFDGDGHAFRARLTRVDRRRARAERLEPLPGRESPLQLQLAVALPKGDGFSLIVQKATELGARSLIPLLTARTTPANRHALKSRLPRWRRIAVEASKQCGRSVVPAVSDPLRLDELLRRDGPSVRLLLDPEGESLPPFPAPPGACLLAIGPEGGFSPVELEAARACGFHRWRIGPRTLRIETAAIAATALLQSAWGDAGSPLQAPGEHP
jgi:16S rRNA (uracil1498-N3)-methyltransferase